MRPNTAWYQSCHTVHDRKYTQDRSTAAAPDSRAGTAPIATNRIPWADQSERAIMPAAGAMLGLAMITSVSPERMAPPRATCGTRRSRMVSARSPVSAPNWKHPTLPTLRSEDSGPQPRTSTKARQTSGNGG